MTWPTSTANGDAIGQFRSAIAATGLSAPDQINPDGALHRFVTNGKRGDSAGWYVLHVEGIPAGAFGDWRTGRTETWCAKSESALSAAERRQIIERMKDAQAAREAERQRRYAQASKTAREVSFLYLKVIINYFLITNKHNIK